VCIILRPLWILEKHFAWQLFLHRLLELSPPCFILSFRGPWVDLLLCTVHRLQLAAARHMEWRRRRRERGLEDDVSLHY
jgi:hypothetical protein